MSEPGSLLRSLHGRTAAQNFHSFVINEIGSAVVSGRYPVGTTIPNDAALMDRFDVSRTVLREALKTLEAKGLLEARPKVGTKVAPRNRWNLFDLQVLAWHIETRPDDAFLAGLTEVRFALEPLAAAHAATHRSADQMRLMRYWLRQMELSLGSVQAFCLADFELHRLVAEASHNPFSRALMGVVELSHALTYLAVGDPPSDERQSILVAVHTALVQAIEKTDGESAAEAMRLVIRTEAAIRAGDV